MHTGPQGRGTSPHRGRYTVHLWGLGSGAWWCHGAPPYTPLSVYLSQDSRLGTMYTMLRTLRLADGPDAVHLAPRSPPPPWTRPRATPGRRLQMVPRGGAHNTGTRRQHHAHTRDGRPERSATLLGRRCNN